MEGKLKLSSPWVTYLNELKAMFSEDADIRIVYSDEEKKIRLYVANNAKAEALDKILIHEKTFGNVALTIDVIPANAGDIDILKTFDDAFLGNPAMAYTMPIESPLGTHRFVIFKNRVVQFFNDQLDDPNGNKSTLYQDIAKDIFVKELAVNYCTDPGSRNFAKPLGEWP